MVTLGMVIRRFILVQQPFIRLFLSQPKHPKPQQRALRDFWGSGLGLRGLGLGGIEFKVFGVSGFRGLGFVAWGRA